MKKSIVIILLISSLVACSNKNNYEQRSYEMKNINNEIKRIFSMVGIFKIIPLVD